MLFCFHGEYAAAALVALRSNPTANRREAADQLLEAAGGRVVEMWGTIGNGPGALVIMDVADPQQAAAICGLVKSSGTMENVKLTRLFTMDEVKEVRGKAAALAGAYKPAGQ